jgi:hypothetical protein
VLADLPREGLAIAMASAHARGIDALATAVTASARDLPFRAVSFDAVVHTDVLC